MNDDCWIPFTTLHHSPFHEVELNVATNKYRHRKVFIDGTATEWIPGEPGDGNKKGPHHGG